MTETKTYVVPAMSCGHCKQTVERAVSEVDGVEEVDADLDSKLVSIRGDAVSDERVRAAIDEAGYEVEAA